MAEFDMAEWSGVTLEEFIDMLEERGYNALRARVIGTMVLMDEAYEDAEEGDDDGE